MISKELKAKATNFLQNIDHKQELIDIIDVLKVKTFFITIHRLPDFQINFFGFLQENFNTNNFITPCLLVLEHVFTELFSKNLIQLENSAGELLRRNFMKSYNRH